MIQNLFCNQIQKSSDFSDGCPTLVCSGQSNSSLLWQDCVMLSSCPFPFILLTVCFPSTFTPLNLFSSLPLSITPSLTLLPLLCPLDEYYYTKQCHSIIKIDPKITYRTYTRVQREMKIGHMTHRVSNTTVFSFTPVLPSKPFTASLISVLNQPG